MNVVVAVNKNREWHILMRDIATRDNQLEISLLKEETLASFDQELRPGVYMAKVKIGRRTCRIDNTCTYPDCSCHPQEVQAFFTNLSKVCAVEEFKKFVEDEW